MSLCEHCYRRQRDDGEQACDFCIRSACSFVSSSGLRCMSKAEYWGDRLCAGHTAAQRRRKDLLLLDAMKVQIWWEHLGGREAFSELSP